MWRVAHGKWSIFSNLLYCRLVATIYKFRPELVKDIYSPTAAPLEETPPKWVSDKFEFGNLNFCFIFTSTFIFPSSVLS